MDASVKKATGSKDLAQVEIPLVRATPESLQGLGVLISPPDAVDVKIVRWPAQGWRPVDTDTGDEAGTTEGLFEFWWENNLLRGRNNAVNDEYILACDARFPEAFDPDVARTIAEDDGGREAALLFHANYHPDGGQLFFPQDKAPFVVPLAPPGDDITPDRVVAFYCDGSKGLYIHPNIWHEGVFAVTDGQRFFDRQGRVHARVSCDFGHEFGIYLSVPLSL